MQPSAKNKKGCDHSNISCFVQLDTASFFTKTYYNKNKNAPKKCHNKDCGKVFGQDYKVGINSPVMVCENAQNKNHDCVFAYCQPCFSEWMNETSTNMPRSKRTRRRGEYDVTNTVAAV